MINARIEVSTFTPVELDYGTRLPIEAHLIPSINFLAEYLSPLTCVNRIAVCQDVEREIEGHTISRGCIPRDYETNCLTTLLKVATYVLSAGILPLLAALTLVVFRSCINLHWIQNNNVESPLPPNIPNEIRGNAGTLPTETRQKDPQEEAFMEHEKEILSRIEQDAFTKKEKINRLQASVSERFKYKTGLSFESATFHDLISTDMSQALIGEEKSIYNRAIQQKRVKSYAEYYSICTLIDLEQNFERIREKLKGNFFGAAGIEANIVREMILIRRSLGIEAAPNEEQQKMILQRFLCEEDVSPQLSLNLLQLETRLRVRLHSFTEEQHGTLLKEILYTEMKLYISKYLSCTLLDLQREKNYIDAMSEGSIYFEAECLEKMILVVQKMGIDGVPNEQQKAEILREITNGPPIIHPDRDSNSGIKRIRG